MHEDISEIWTFHLRYVLGDGSPYYLTSSYYYTVMGPDTVYAERDILLLNTKTHQEYNGALKKGTALYGADKRCAIAFSYNNTDTGVSFVDWWSRQNGTTEYIYHFQIYNNTEKVVEGSVSMLDRVGKPVFLKENGFIYIPGQSTIYGYLQPRLKIDGGYLNSGGRNSTIVEGYGDLTHLWGGLPNVVGNLFIINLPRDYTAILAKYDYSGNGTLAFSSIVLVKPDNSFEILNGKLVVNPEKFAFSPYDPKHTVVWAYEWTVLTDNPALNMTVKGVSSGQFTRYYWYGLCYANGTFEGKTYSVDAFTEITRHYMSFIHITHHQLELNPEIPTENLTVSCQVNHTLPIKSVVMKYNTSRDKNWSSVDLTNNTKYYVFNGDEYSDIWEGTVPGQPLFTTVYYYIEVTDISGHTERTVLDSKEVQIEYPD